MQNLPSLGPRGEGWVVLQFVLLVAIAVVGWVLGPDWAETAAMASYVIGIGTMVTGLALAFRGVVDLGASLTPLPHPGDAAELVETGIYERVRHPIYGGLILAAFGWAFLNASLVTLLLAAVLLAFFVLKSTREEAWLMTRYAGYAAYRERTRRFIPWIG